MPGTDPIARAHLTAGRPSPPIHRYLPAPELAGLIRQYWVPVWDIPAGQHWEQRVLQYPISLVVISADYARCYGVVRGLSTVTLAGSGWAFGVMMQPATGYLLAAAPMSALTDRHVTLGEMSFDWGDLEANTRTLMASDPADPAVHHQVRVRFEQLLLDRIQLDPEGQLINDIVAFVEGSRDVLRVRQICAEFSVTERALQRLTGRRLGLTPKWLIQRRRLHEAVAELSTGQQALADLAVSLGYTDQAHFTRDFRAVTASSPGDYLRRLREAPHDT